MSATEGGFLKPGIKERFDKVKANGKYVLVVVICVLMVLFIIRLKRKIGSQITVARTGMGFRGSRGCRGVPTDETIFVAITSTASEMERTARCVGTLFDACMCPKRVFVGICQTGSDSKRKRGGWKSSRFIEVYKKVNRKHGEAFTNNIRVINEPEEEAKGYSNAMNLIQVNLYRGERFFMTMDNSLCVTQDWDSLLVADMKKCSKKSEKYIITQAPSLNKKRARSTNPTYMIATQWSEHGTPIIVHSRYKNPPVRPFRSLFYTSAFSFALGAVAREVVYDPWYQHLPRDVVDWPHSVRLWTNQWDFYSPSSAVVTWSEHSENETSRHYSGYSQQEEELAFLRLWCFFRFVHPGSVDLDPYRPGSIRSEEQYRIFSGVDWTNRVLQPHARVGMCVVDPSRRRTRDLQYPFENEEVVAKYGSWTEFYEATDYRDVARPSPSEYR